jgi:hypothetical protein
VITLLREGIYDLIETKHQTKILTLDGQRTYAWIVAEGMGEVLVDSHKTHKTDQILARGEYRLYQVKDEPELADMQHLELEVGRSTWQGYLLLKGLPTQAERRHRIIPTTELITGKSGQNSFAREAHKNGA